MEIRLWIKIFVGFGGCDVFTGHFALANMIPIWKSGCGHDDFEHGNDLYASYINEI